MNSGTAMFKKTRLRIFGLIMAAATVIITLMLSVIYVANTNYAYERGISLLESYTDNAGGMHPSMNNGSNHPGFGPGIKDDHKKMFDLSTFYSVIYNRNGDVIKVDYGDGYLYSEEEILEIADSILKENKDQGIYNKMPYLVRNKFDGTIVALIDHTMEMDNSNRLFGYSLTVGISGWIIIMILAWFFSKRVVDPLVINDQKQKQFISDAGHELKTPISVISANAELLSLEIGENKWLSNIQYENERMGNLVKQLLELVRAENMQVIKERIDFTRLVKGGSLPFESVAYENKMPLNIEIEDDIYVFGNQNQLSQLVSILLDNAFEHGEKGKEVSLKLNSTKHHAVLTVTNSGESINDEIKDRLFERFYRVDEARTDEFGHYGLGLAIAKAIVNSHNGKIELECHDGLIEFKITIPKD